tara:strand:- start:2857 stop:3393 length:537 start_codon:yes stop_codon:yes gene_type:complete
MATTALNEQTLEQMDFEKLEARVLAMWPPLNLTGCASPGNSLLSFGGSVTGRVSGKTILYQWADHEDPPEVTDSDLEFVKMAIDNRISSAEFLDVCRFSAIRVTRTVGMFPIVFRLRYRAKTMAPPKGKRWHPAFPPIIDLAKERKYVFSGAGLSNFNSKWNGRFRGRCDCLISVEDL